MQTPSPSGIRCSYWKSSLISALASGPQPVQKGICHGLGLAGLPLRAFWGVPEPPERSEMQAGWEGRTRAASPVPRGLAALTQARCERRTASRSRAGRPVPGPADGVRGPRVPRLAVSPGASGSAHVPRRGWPRPAQPLPTLRAPLSASPGAHRAASVRRCPVRPPPLDLSVSSACAWWAAPPIRAPGVQTRGPTGLRPDVHPDARSHLRPRASWAAPCVPTAPLSLGSTWCLLHPRWF